MSVLNVQAEDHWPDVLRLPTPDQARHHVVASQLVALDESGVSTVEFGPATVLPLLFGTFGGSRQGRRLLRAFIRKAMPFLASVAAVVLIVWRF
jgi:hypothetical protein